MQNSVSYGGMYDELLTSEVNSARRDGKRISKFSLIATLRRGKRMPLQEAERVVEDFCKRGAVQSLLGDSPYDEWLTQQIEAAYQAKRGITATVLTKRLRKAYAAELAGVEPSALTWVAEVGIGWSNANDIVHQYFARHALKHVLGPFPLVGVLSVSSFELLFLLPIAWILHMASSGLISHLSYLRAAHVVSIFLLVVVCESLFRNWRKTRSKDRWDSYKAVRAELLARYCRETTAA